MRQIIKSKQLLADEWPLPGEEAGSSGAVRLTLIDYLAWRGGAVQAAVPAGARVSVRLEPADDEADLLPYLGQLPLIDVHFPKSAEGRGYTQGRMLRERHGYTGELRASGAVFIDQIYLLARCGFDSFELAEGQDPQAIIAELHRFSVAYQPMVDGLTQPLRRHR